eukprot:CAMPEP_0184345938 /NCGR_PEP_ID=MMETSP1089-20130417/14265_1 /TAXON_ID=38269 ORGANISM="Gloeochaete wittrockiana, Strain SAG46.84" /NCGR_SAMPLE_ID=MMETSP1089 /ASSEMBLY_ACC=CAM_ASM_000445 /LENGTH=1051 /DNA_ID=CAMNT_0026676421 /DNA_START=85 /DNA_END=3237 /DNA_ORIENTATION=-
MGVEVVLQRKHSDAVKDSEDDRGNEEASVDPEVKAEGGVRLSVDVSKESDIDSVEGMKEEGDGSSLDDWKEYDTNSPQGTKGDGAGSSVDDLKEYDNDIVEDAKAEGVGSIVDDLKEYDDDSVEDTKAEGVGSKVDDLKEYGNDVVEGTGAEGVGSSVDDLKDYDTHSAEGTEGEGIGLVVEDSKEDVTSGADDTQGDGVEPYVHDIHEYGNGAIECKKGHDDGECSSFSSKLCQVSSESLRADGEASGQPPSEGEVALQETDAGRRESCCSVSSVAPLSDELEEAKTDPADKDADPLESEADPLESEADPLESEADPLESEADSEADPLESEADTGADPIETDAAYQEGSFVVLGEPPHSENEVALKGETGGTYGAGSCSTSNAPLLYELTLAQAEPTRDIDGAYGNGMAEEEGAKHVDESTFESVESTSAIGLTVEGVGNTKRLSWYDECVDDEEDAVYSEDQCYEVEEEEVVEEGESTNSQQTPYDVYAQTPYDVCAQTPYDVCAMSNDQQQITYNQPYAYSVEPPAVPMPRDMHFYSYKSNSVPYMHYSYPPSSHSFVPPSPVSSRGTVYYSYSPPQPPQYRSPHSAYSYPTHPMLLRPSSSSYYPHYSDPHRFLMSAATTPPPPPPPPAAVNVYPTSFISGVFCPPGFSFNPSPTYSTPAISSTSSAQPCPPPQPPPPPALAQADSYPPGFDCRLSASPRSTPSPPVLSNLAMFPALSSSSSSKPTPKPIIMPDTETSPPHSVSMPTRPVASFVHPLKPRSPPRNEAAVPTQQPSHAIVQHHSSDPSPQIPRVLRPHKYKTINAINRYTEEEDAGPRGPRGQRLRGGRASGRGGSVPSTSCNPGAAHNRGGRGASRSNWTGRGGGKQSPSNGPHHYNPSAQLCNQPDNLVEDGTLGANSSIQTTQIVSLQGERSRSSTRKADHQEEPSIPKRLSKPKETNKASVNLLADLDSSSDPTFVVSAHGTCPPHAVCDAEESDDHEVQDVSPKDHSAVEKIAPRGTGTKSTTTGKKNRKSKKSRKAGATSSEGTEVLGLNGATRGNSSFAW